MKLLVISSAPIVVKKSEFYLYAPYEKEMQLWARNVDEIQFCCPIWSEDKKLLIVPITFEIAPTIVLSEFDIKTSINALKAIPIILKTVVQIFQAMKRADHIHLRCPGNIGLLAAFVQLFFPKTPKTVKYAGNWDPKSAQPWSYRLQKWLLSNTFFTRNTKVLVYGEWEGRSKNVKPFFTATYSESEKQHATCEIRSVKDELIRFLFVGTLSEGKKPLYAIQLVEALHKKGTSVILELYGEGILRIALEQYIIQNNLEAVVFLKGNQTKATVLKAYQTSHFLILPSKSEGWPKVVAEAMFWGCFPLVTAVSCVPFMLDYGNRGIILNENLSADAAQIASVIARPMYYLQAVEQAMEWSRQFTTDKFEMEIKKLLID